MFSGYLYIFYSFSSLKGLQKQTLVLFLQLFYLLSDDFDKDGLSNKIELIYGTNPFDADSDNDGIVDGKEALWNKDSDGDQLINALDQDSDNDMLLDSLEDKNGNGKSRPALVHVRDVVGTAYFLHDKREAIGEIFNIADDSKYTVEEPLLAAAKILNVKIYRIHIPM